MRNEKVELIYAWIEEFRCLEKVGFHINKSFHVEVSDLGFTDILDYRSSADNIKFH